MPTIGERLARVEAILERIEERMDKFSEQGRAPTAVPAKPRMFGLVPGTGRELAIALTALATVAGMGGVTWFGSQGGASSGATTAIEDAVKQGEAVPLAAPVLRVLPVPQVVPVPVPQPPVPEPDPVVRPDDLMPQVVP